MAYCSNCGKEIQPGSIYCNQCGNKIIRTTTNTQKKVVSEQDRLESKRNTGAILMYFGIAAFGFTMAGVLAGEAKEGSRVLAIGIAAYYIFGEDGCATLAVISAIIAFIGFCMWTSNTVKK